MRRAPPSPRGRRHGSHGRINTVEVPVQRTEIAAEHAAACGIRAVLHGRESRLAASKAQDRCAVLIALLVRIAVFGKPLSTELDRPLRDGIDVSSVRRSADAFVVRAYIVRECKNAWVVDVKLLQKRAKWADAFRRLWRRHALGKAHMAKPTVIGKRALCARILQALRGCMCLLACLALKQCAIRKRHFIHIERWAHTCKMEAAWTSVAA